MSSVYNDFLNILNCTASALDGLFVPITDVSHYRWITVGIDSSPYVGRLIFEACMNDPSANEWIPLIVYNLNGLFGIYGGTSDTGIMVGTSCGFPWFRVRMSSYTSGEAKGAFYAYAQGLPGFVPLTFGSVLNPSNEFVGFTNNSGKQTAAIASGATSDTIVSPSPGMIGSVLVTTQNTHQMIMYDNDTTASGTIVCVIPASQPVDGKPFSLNIPLENGIFVPGNANNPGVTVSYTSL